jgi:dihydroorotate dehydrogenase
VNRLGLPSPGIASLAKHDLTGRILSVHGFAPAEWAELGFHALRMNPAAVEANLSCPNVDRESVASMVDACRILLGLGLPVIAKLPPVRWMDLARPLYGAGVRAFHLCNTIPTPGGGVSGKPLLPFALWAVADVRQAFGDRVCIIGGGGVTGVEDVAAYRTAGANHVAVGSTLLNPLHWRRLPALAAALATPEGARHGTPPQG